MAPRRTFARSRHLSRHAPPGPASPSTPPRNAQGDSPVNTMHPTIEDSRINIARHEFGHAWLAHELGFVVEGISLEDHPDRHTGCAEIAYPLDCATFGETYERSPLRAAAWA